MTFILLLMITGIVIYIIKGILNKNHSMDDNDCEILGNKLGTFISSFVKNCDFLKTKQEQMEMCFCLALEAVWRVGIKYNYNQAEKIGATMNKYLFSISEMGILSERMLIYSAHKEMIGLSTNTRAFVLSYFLYKARGKTTGKDITDLLLGERKISPSDMSEVPDIEEVLKLNGILAGACEEIIAII